MRQGFPEVRWQRSQRGLCLSHQKGLSVCACLCVCTCVLTTAVLGQVYLVPVPREPGWAWEGTSQQEANAGNGVGGVGGL